MSMVSPIISSPRCSKASAQAGPHASATPATFHGSYATTSKHG